MSDLVVPDELRALTLHRPWCRGFCEGDKPFDNRGRPAPRTILGKPLALHAGQAWSERGASILERLLGRRWRPDEVRAGVVVAVVTVTGTLTESASRWWLGPFAWSFTDVTPIEPVEVPPGGCHQGVWRLPNVSRHEVWTRYLKAQEALRG